jgi:hypothetical protein
MEEELVYGFIQAVDGEKDPRCLIVVFQLAEKIAKEFSLTRFKRLQPCVRSNYQMSWFHG